MLSAAAMASALQAMKIQTCPQPRFGYQRGTWPFGWFESSRSGLQESTPRGCKSGLLSPNSRLAALLSMGRELSILPLCPFPPCRILPRPQSLSASSFLPVSLLPCPLGPAWKGPMMAVARPVAAAGTTGKARLRFHSSCRPTRAPETQSP